MAKSRTQPFSKLLTAAKKEEFLDLLRRGMQRGAATDIVFDDDNPDRRRAMREYILEDAEFEQRVLDAEEDATEHIEEALYQAAISGSVAAAAKWLEYKGKMPTASRGRPAKPAAAAAGESEEQAGDSLYNVTPLDPRLRRAQSEGD